MSPRQTEAKLWWAARFIAKMIVEKCEARTKRRPSTFYPSLMPASFPINKSNNKVEASSERAYLKLGVTGRRLKFSGV